ncbi:MAG: DUF4055 domain-containing protein [Cyanobacteria bacterium J06559_3]
MPISDRHPDYKQSAPVWQYLEDVYQGLLAWAELKPGGAIAPGAKAKNYLPALANESGDDYNRRFRMSHFDDRFASAVRDFAGIVFGNGIKLVDVPQPILDIWSHLGRGGLHGDLFCSRLGQHALRLGHSFVLVDFNPYDAGVRSLADMGKRHPFWCAFGALQIINWDYISTASADVLTRVVLAYQARGEAHYLELLPGEYRIWRQVEGRDRKVQDVLVDAGPMGRVVRGRVQPFDFVPLICCYSGDRTGFLKSNPTLWSLAALNIHHYQVSSDHRMKMHTVCYPQPVREGGQGEPLKLGYRLAVDVPIGGRFGYAEANANSLAMSRQEVADIETKMDFLGAEYLVKPRDRQAAATTGVQAAKVESKLFLYAQDFAEGLSRCLDVTAKYLGLDHGGRAVLDTKFFEAAAADPQLLLAYLNMHERELLSRDEVRSLAQEKKFFPDNFMEVTTNGNHGRI